MSTVLVVDDEPGIRRLYERALKRQGYAVVLASNAREALEESRKTPLDLVVLDINMPGMNGLDLMSRILEEDNEMPVVISTAYPTFKDSFLSWSADAYLTKSSDVTELTQTIQTLLEARSG